jgi:hypothetical protein
LIPLHRPDESQRRRNLAGNIRRWSAEATKTIEKEYEKWTIVSNVKAEKRLHGLKSGQTDTSLNTIIQNAEKHKYVKNRTRPNFKQTFNYLTAKIISIVIVFAVSIKD